MASLELRGVSIEHAGVRVLDGVNLTVGDAERVALLGPSGSGKTTLLRAVAGLEPVAAGTVVLAGRDVTSTSTRERDVAMVDQQASLQPHLDVAANVGFPLTLRRVRDAEVARRVDAEAGAFSIRRLLRRRPRTLAAGERHEVALARSLVRRVPVLLLDEPLARADVPRRAELLRELLRVQEGYEVALLLATNDQATAMSLAHRCAVLDRGRVVQLGPPTALYDAPASAFVAGFVGSPPMNLLSGHVERAARGVRIVADPLRLTSFAPAIADLVGSRCTVGLRPTALHRAAAPPNGAGAGLEEVVHHRAFLGDRVEVRLGEPSNPVVAVVERPAPPEGALLALRFEPRDVHVFGPDGQAVSHGI